MSSKARAQLVATQRRAEFIMIGLKAPGIPRSVPSDERQVILHAYLAASVANFEAYIEDVTLEFLSVCQRFSSKNPSPLLRGLIAAKAQQATDRFNTPNFENCRRHLTEYTGWDPYPSWVWTPAALSATATQRRLNEILQVRHSFAHGRALQPYDWLHESGGRRYLSQPVLARVAAMLTFLADRTDLGLEAHMRAAVDSMATW